MKQIFTYPLNPATNYIDPDYVGDATSGLTRRVDELIAGNYKNWTNLTPVVSTATAEESLSKFINYLDEQKVVSNLTMYDFWNTALVVSDKTLIADDVTITSANTLQPATITTSAPHDFEDGWLINLEGFDGTWGAYYSDKDLYAKRLSNTELQVARDSGLTDIIGFSGAQPFETLANQVKVLQAINGGNVIINFANDGYTPANGSVVTFTSVANANYGELLQTDYYIKQQSGFVYEIKKDAALTQNFTMDDFRVFLRPDNIGNTDVENVTINSLTNPATITFDTAPGTITNEPFWVDSPNEWYDGSFNFTSVTGTQKFYYLKDIGDPTTFEVYLDEAYTIPVNWDLTYSPSVTIGMSPVTSPDHMSVSFTSPTWDGLQDGDKITFGTNSGPLSVLDGSDFYLKLIPGATDADWHMYQDQALTIPVSALDYTMPPGTPVDNIRVINRATNKKYLVNAADISGFGTKVIATVDNPHWGITAGDNINADEVTGGYSLSDTQVPFTFNADGDWDNIYWNENSEVKFYDSNYWTNTIDNYTTLDELKTVVEITAVEKNGANLVGNTQYQIYQPGFNDAGKYLYVLQDMNGNDIVIDDFTNYSLSGASDGPANPFSVTFSSAIDTEDQIAKVSGDYTSASGNLVILNDGDDVTLKPVSGNTYEVWRPEMTTSPHVKYHTPVNTTNLTSTGSVTDLTFRTNKTFMTVPNASGYTSGEKISLTSGNYIPQYGNVDWNNLYVDTGSIAGTIELYTDSLLTTPVTAYTFSENEMLSVNNLNIAVTCRYFNNAYRFFDSNGDIIDAEKTISFNVIDGALNALGWIPNQYDQRPVAINTDGLLYTDNLYTNELLDQRDPVQIDQIVDLAAHSFWPLNQGNRYWNEIYDDAGTVAINNPANAFYGGLTLTDYTDMDLDTGANEARYVDGVSSLPFAYSKFIAGGNPNNRELDNDPKRLSLSHVGPTIYTLNGKKLAYIENYESGFASDYDVSAGISSNSFDIRDFCDGAVAGMLVNTPYVMKNYNRDDGVDSVVAIKIDIGIDTCLVFDTWGWDTGAPTQPANSAYNKPDGLYNGTLMANTQGLEKFPALNGQSTEITGFDLADAISFHNWDGVDRQIDAGWPKFATTVNTGANLATEQFLVDDRDIKVQRVVIPKLKKYTLNSLLEIRPYLSNVATRTPGHVSVKLDPNISNTEMNPYYGFFNSGDIINLSGKRYFAVKIHNNGSQMMVGNGNWEDLVVGSSPRYFSDNDWYTHNITAVDYEAEEWAFYAIDPVDNGGGWEQQTDLIWSNIILDGYEFVPASGTNVWFYRPEPGLDNYTIEAGNIASGTVRTDTLVNPSVIDTDFQLRLNEQISVSDYTQGTVDYTIDELPGPNLLVAPVTLGEVSLKRLTNINDRLDWLVWKNTDNSVSYQVPNRVVNDWAQVFDLKSLNTIGVVGEVLTDSTTGTVSLSPNQPLPYKLGSTNIHLPGNKVYTYQDTNNQTVPAARIDQDAYWQAGDLVETNYTDNGEIIPNISVSVDGTGYLQSVTLQSDAGRFHNSTQIITPIVDLPDTYVPVPQTPAQQQDNWDTDDEWASTAFNAAKEWPRHVSPSSASITLNTPSDSQVSQNGIKFTRGSGFTKWTLDVEYPPMKAEDFQKFHAVAQAAQGQVIPFYFVLRNKDGNSILWADFDLDSTPDQVLYREDYSASDSVLLLEGFAFNETDAFRRGEVVIDGENQNGALHTVVNQVNANVFGEAKIRLAYPLRQPVITGESLYKNPEYAVVTLSTDEFTYTVDTAGYYKMSVSFDLDGWK